MNTPICNFIKSYAEHSPTRMHMPGHKGVRLLGFESSDITEIDGADELFEPNGIIAESERNASRLFGAQTLYSAGGSTLCIQAMLYLISRYAAEKCEPTRILACRNAHRAFINAAALLGTDVEWLYPSVGSYHSCKISPEIIEKEIIMHRPTALYLTSPDYLGNIADIKKISDICRKHGVIFAVDNAHGAYLKFLSESRHPIDLGADICCDSAHKTLPVITGGAYLHISPNAPKVFSQGAKAAFSLFGSSSPSYLILQSLDCFNGYAEKFQKKLADIIPKINKLKAELSDYGYDQISEEPLKITLGTKCIGYTGTEIAEFLEKRNIYPEFYDSDFIVFMLSAENSVEDIAALKSALSAVRHRPKIRNTPPPIPSPKRVLSPREALLMPSENLPIESCLDKICALSVFGCPPAVPLIVCGESIDEAVIENLKYYGIDRLNCCIYRDSAE